jgi:hypothetical protein
MDVNRVRQGERIAGIAGVVLLISLWFSWYGASASVGGFEASTSASGWESLSWIDIFLFITAVVAIGFGIMSATGSQTDLPIAGSSIVAGLGGLATLMVLFRIIDIPGDIPEGVDVSRKLGVFIALIAAAGVTYGGYVGMQEEGTSFGDEADKLR